LTPIALKFDVRLVLDTNTVISGLLWQGAPGRLIDAAQTKSITLFTSVSLLAELRGVLAREKFAGQLQARALNVSEVFDGYAALAMIAAPAGIASIVTSRRRRGARLCPGSAGRSHSLGGCSLAQSQNLSRHSHHLGNRRVAANRTRLNHRSSAMRVTNCFREFVSDPGEFNK
jgi:hypothetical protein